MNEFERKALRKAKRILKRDLDPLVICPILYENDMLRTKQYDTLSDLRPRLSRRELCHRFLKFIMKHDSKCTYKGLIAALRRDQTYEFLADELETILRRQENKSNSRSIPTSHSGQKVKHDSNDSHEAMSVDYGTSVTDDDVTVDYGTSVTDDDVTVQPKQNFLYKSVNKIDVLTAKRARVTEIAYKLKRLRHEGDMDALERLTGDINSEFDKSPFSSKMGEVADMKFVALEAMANAGRMKYDGNQCDQCLEEMKDVIPFTSQPHISSMTYLARYGSSVAMQGKHRLDDALGLLQCARQHAADVQSGLETGMVCYIQLNLLCQKYEDTPTEALQEQTLNTAELAIAQFQGLPDDIRSDYERMLQLKMVFCRLGIGLFGKCIESVKPTAAALSSAKSSLDVIEKPDNWKRLETRRIMLYHVAKSVFHQHQGITDLALLHGREAERIAMKNKWNAELPNIVDHIEKLEMS